MSDDMLRVHSTADVWEHIADGRANDEKLLISGYQAHDTAHTLRKAAAEIERLRADHRITLERAREAEAQVEWIIDYIGAEDAKLAAAVRAEMEET